MLLSSNWSPDGEDNVREQVRRNRALACLRAGGDRVEWGLLGVNARQWLLVSGCCQFWLCIVRVGAADLGIFEDLFISAIVYEARIVRNIPNLIAVWLFKFRIFLMSIKSV